MTDPTARPLRRVPDPDDDTGDRCACGAPAALAVGYRGEAGPETYTWDEGIAP